jgi:hypothetical protein
MKKNFLPLSYLFTITTFMVSCSSSDSNDSTPTPETYYKIVNNGNGGVTSITDNSDSATLKIAQAIPSVSNVPYPANIPIVFFFDDKILLSSITEESFIVTENDVQVTGTISINEGSNGFAIFNFTPKTQFAANANIKIRLTSGLKDDAGVGLETEQIYEYTTSAVANRMSGTSSFDGNYGFENGSAGVNFIGDGNIIGTSGCISPFGGSQFACLTSGNGLVSTSSAIGGASSIMIVGPITGATDITSLSFKYNFLSAEFQEFVDSIYDDTFIAIVFGANGAHSEFINSVNTIGLAGNQQCGNFPGMPDDGDAYAGSTGWLNKVLNFANVGSEVYVAFIITDVSDEAYSSVLGVDDISHN